MTDEVKKAALDFLSALKEECIKYGKLYGTGWNNLHGSNDVLSAFHAGYAHARRWIPTSERLPEIDEDDSGNHPHLWEYKQSERVLLLFKDEDMDGSRVFIGRAVSVLREGVSSRHEQWWECDEEGSVDVDDVLCWQPLPAAPREGK